MCIVIEVDKWLVNDRLVTSKCLVIKQEAAPIDPLEIRCTLCVLVFSGSTYFGAFVTSELFELISEPKKDCVRNIFIFVRFGTFKRLGHKVIVK